jgi:hypothetical protein
MICAMTTAAPPPAPAPAVGDKGLKKDALGFVSSVVIGVASTASGCTHRPSCSWRSSRCC